MSSSSGPASKSVLALVDSSPVLLLPSVLACRERSGERPLHVSLAGPIQSEAALARLVAVLGRHSIEASIQARGDTLESTVQAWLGGAAADAGSPLLDVSSASGGTATRAVLALQQDGRPYQLCWFNEANNEVHFSLRLGADAPRSGHALVEAHTNDIGSRRSVKSAVDPRDFMAVFGLERSVEDPYCGLSRMELVPMAAQLLQVALHHPKDYSQFRQAIAPARLRAECRVPLRAFPSTVRPLIDSLARLDGWVRHDRRDVVFRGTGDQRGVFLLSGGWLEIAVADAVGRALPDHHVQMNCGTTWGRKRRTEAEMDVAFVYHNALYLLSCKNEHLTDRFFPHLDRFRALTAEFGESRTRPVLLSTTELEARHIRRCDAYEIGQISGRTLLELLDRSLKDEADALLKGLLTVSRGAPRAGLA